MKLPDSLPGRFQPQPKLYRSEYPNQMMLLHKGFAEIGVFVAVEQKATLRASYFYKPADKYCYWKLLP
ncbi:hypothetical protein WA1_07665 [Scytonema hofmannii PCC 7110]|uniref:Uncharacterized protein n=1 Tax=Scytonema hofmannii PCC 7110 TaxID=128403 RepID=A0A139WTB2_9CYAN|nr:hypothetical protein [Scytonema hofmannii]KYC35676.1 hypothetical protein WA1_07665 [Scytonema hofmannii PCC 7110]